MKKSKKKLAVAALLAGSVVVSATSCHKSNPTGSGGTNSEAGITGAAGEANSAAGVTNEVFVPDDNMNEDVYGPPADME